MLDIALQWVDRGFSVFPCRSNKKPYTTNGFKDASRDKDKIRQWWNLYPDALIGMPTGNGILVGDLDRKNGIDGYDSWLDLEQQYSPAPDTYTVCTQNNGLHKYFRTPPGYVGKSSAGKLGLGIDIRSDGGYVIAAGSPGYEAEGSTTYEMAMAPMWLLSKCADNPPPLSDGISDKVDISPDQERFDVRQAVANILAGSPLHDSCRGMAAHLISTGVTHEGAINIIRGVMDNSRARYDRKEEWQDRRDDIPRLVLTAAKFAPELPQNSVPSKQDLALTTDEWHLASLTPRCIVKNHTYADVAQVVAPGGTGKTTLLLYESVLVALSRPVWGNMVESPGWTLIITAEDERQRLVARLREICKAMELSEIEIAKVKKSIVIWDVTGQQKKLVFSHDGNLMLTSLADDVITTFSDDPPAICLFDPLVSFGAAEQAVNDNEQAIVTACRRIVRGLGCCVRVVHHTGKGNAREKTLDQYSGRGGSAMADGSRMTTVLAAWEPNMKGVTMPQGMKPSPDSSITILARPKLSYSPPNLPLIWIKRTGFKFDYAVEPQVSADEAAAAKAAQLLQFLRHELTMDRRHTKTGLEQGMLDKLGMTRSVFRAALYSLECSELVWSAKLPRAEQHGGKKEYLHPAEATSNSAGFGGVVKNDA